MSWTIEFILWIALAFAMWIASLAVILHREEVKAWLSLRWRRFRGRDINDVPPSPTGRTQEASDSFRHLVPAAAMTGLVTSLLGRLRADGEVEAGTLGEEAIEAFRRGAQNYRSAWRTVHGESLLNIDFDEAERRALAQIADELPAVQDHDTSLGEETRQHVNTTTIKFSPGMPQGTPDDEECEYWVNMRRRTFLRPADDEWEDFPAPPNGVGGFCMFLADGREVASVVHTIDLPGVTPALLELQRVQRKNRGAMRWEEVDKKTTDWLWLLPNEQRIILFVLAGIEPPYWMMEAAAARESTDRKRLLDLDYNGS